MLISEIERNRATEAEKQLERIILLNRAHGVSDDEDHREFARHLAKKHGFLVRRAGRADVNRRQNAANEDFPQEMERRHTGERRKMSRWNPQNYEVLVVAVERDTIQPHSWMSGERVNLEPVSDEPQSPASGTGASTPKQDSDYVVHLSGHADQDQ